jgi:mono/diheme cytochrome c family protein
LTLRPAIRAFPLFAAMVAALTPLWAAKPVRATPHNDYMLQCQGCHMADGSGSPGSVPDLRGNLVRFLTVAGGREFLIRVPGSAQSPLSDAELAEVLNWMVRAFDPAAVARRFTPFTAQEVAAHRTPLADVVSVRTALMERIASGSSSPPDPAPGHRH